jgi:endonuclease/exonuclease/phosphatase family metal-dependent hydrolase
MLSRYPILESHVVPLPSSKDNRYFLEARLNVSGKDVWAYVVHLGLPAQDREDETVVLLQHVESRRGPAIIAGDFNSCPHVVCPDYDGRMDTVYDTMAAKFVDTYKVTSASHNESDPAAFTYEAQKLTHRIDYVWVTADFIVHDAKSVTSAAAIHGSDHVPVLATLELP